MGRQWVNKIIWQTKNQGWTDMTETDHGHDSVSVCVYSPEHEKGAVPVCTRSPPGLSPANSHSDSGQSRRTPSAGPCCVWPSASSPGVTATTTFIPTTMFTLHYSHNNLPKAVTNQPYPWRTSPLMTCGHPCGLSCLCHWSPHRPCLRSSKRKQARKQKKSEGDRVGTNREC